MTRTRIVGFDPAVPADQILAHPHNPKRHPGSQREIMRGLMDEVGWVAPMIVNVQTQHLIDGHMRVEEEITRGGTVPVVYIDVPEADEPTILATFDPIRALAEQDDENLDWVLSEAQVQSDYLVQFLAGQRQHIDELVRDHQLEPSASIGTVGVNFIFTREQFEIVEKAIDSVAESKHAEFETGAHRTSFAVYLMCRDYLGDS